MWLARKAISPPALRHTTISASPEYIVREGATNSTWVVAMAASVLLLKLAGLLADAVDASHVEERLLGDIVEIAVDQRFEGLHRVRYGDEDPLEAGEHLADEERL